MNAIDGLLLMLAFAFIALLVLCADELEDVEDDNGYNSEQGKRDAE